MGVSSISTMMSKWIGTRDSTAPPTAHPLSSRQSPKAPSQPFCTLYPWKSLAHGLCGGRGRQGVKMPRQMKAFDVQIPESGED